ncbi:hypothetical protein D9619_002535 [Psilocybe cf. subviscida]|uniref:Carboxylic ester hydrolase n=1 Tax=Psilocybe cf. subviscida TaxID=2480587 RepID=A0A8H5AXL0_9AGAR|nr:hypothetical protein D9619_002535 [Psilocybe cf. subviscida]
MSKGASWLLLLALQASVTSATPLLRATAKIDAAVVSGVTNGLATKFLGIPFAKPPARFVASEAPLPYKGTLNAKAYGPSCPQQKIDSPDTGIAAITQVINEAPELHDAISVESEDCLTLNIIKPTISVPNLIGQPLPVLVWIHGGAYQIGDTASYDQMGTDLVKRSLALGKPMIYVSINYRQADHSRVSDLFVHHDVLRLSAYGFLAGTQIFKEGNGNLGLRDQRLALKWINKYIHAFGGDSSKVTIWGQSSGAISVGLQMMTNGGNTEGLFRAGFMQSGAPLPVGNITKGTGQVFYDVLTQDTGCASAADSLACLRALPFPVLKASVDKTPSFFSYLSLALVWHPSVDGVFLQDNPQALVRQGKFANVPIVSGTCDDEGTLFGLSSLNVTTDADFRNYISSVWLSKNPVSELDALWSYYPADVAQGSPFNTSSSNALTPQFMRVSAFIGDSVQQGPRRMFLNKAVSQGQKVWSYLSRRVKDTPGIGSYHGSDLAIGVINDNLINFVTSLDPNTNGHGANANIHWPQYSAAAPMLYTFPAEANSKPKLTPDTYRKEAIDYLNGLALAHPFVL